MKRRITCCALLCSIPLFFYATAGGRDRNGNTNQIKESGSIEASGEKKDEGAEHKLEPSLKENAVPEDTGKAAEPGEVKETEEPAADAEKISDEKSGKPVRKRAGNRKSTEPVREPRDDLLLIDNEGIRNGRIPGITLKTEKSPDNAIVKIPEDKIARKTEDKKKKNRGLFGASTETIAKVGLLLFILIVLIIYKTRTKKTKRKVVRTIHKR